MLTASKTSSGSRGSTDILTAPYGKKFDALQNPLRAVALRFSCSECGKFDVEGQRNEDDKFLCSRCRAGDTNRSCAYTSLIYGDNSQFVLGAIVLGKSLEGSGTRHDRILMHTKDVPEHSRALLSKWWQLREVPYIMAAQDLFIAPYEKARFKEVFTKLHVFNPAFLPYDKVVFLDLDMVVLKNVDDLFAIRPPAAMYNVKTNGGCPPAPPHGEFMDAHDTYINAGTMVIAPSQMLFDLLAADVLELDPLWHHHAWSPEQAYLSKVLAGQWSHVSQLYNFEVKLHSGVPLCKLWQDAGATDIFVAHFSGSPKVWDCEPDEVTPPISHDFVKQAFSKFAPRTRMHVNMRCRALHAEWHHVLAAAMYGVDSSSLRMFSIFRGKRGDNESASCDASSGLSIGDRIVVSDAEESEYFATVVRLRQGIPIFRRVPGPEELEFCEGMFGLCYAKKDEQVLTPFDKANSEAEPSLGSSVAVWCGEGHLQGEVAARRGRDCLVQFRSQHAPQWHQDNDLHVLNGDEQSLVLQCCSTKSWSEGAFRNGMWFAAAAPVVF